MCTFVKPIFHWPEKEDYFKAATVTADWLLESANKSDDGYD